MKKYLSIAAILAATCSSQASADTLAFKAAYFQDDSNDILSFAIEHPIPLLPNFRYANQDSGDVTFSYPDSDPNTGIAFDNFARFSYERQDYTLYYELLNNSLIHLDLGAGLSVAEVGYDFALGDALVVGSDDETGGHLYAKARMPFGESGLGLYAETTIASISGMNVVDASAGVTYTLSLSALDLRAYAGYAHTSYTDSTLIFDRDIESDSARFGFEIDL